MLCGCPCAAEDFKIQFLPFNCLAVETATELPSVALLRGDALAVRENHGLRTPSRAVFEWVRELLAETETSFDQLDCVAFGAGPGSFTGVRVAVALAQGLGYARGLPLCPVSTLASLALGALCDTPADTVACCLDARMGEVYVGVYARHPEEGVRAVSPDALLKPEAVIVPDGGSCLAAGPGWLAYPHMAARLGDRLLAVEPSHWPSAAGIARLARHRFLANQLVLAADARPNYLRDRVASVS